MKAKLLTLALIIFSTQLFAQVGINTVNPSASSILDATATDKGILIPRVALTNTTDATTIPLPATSLLIYNTTLNTSINPGFYFWDGTVWKRLLSNTNVPHTFAAGTVQANGTALKIYGATVSRIDLGDYQITFTTPRTSANYVINLANIDCADVSPCDYDDPGITYYNRTVSGFRINIGDSDNGNTAKEDIDLEFTFSVIDF